MSTKIFAILDKESGEFITCNGHAAFSSVGNAKRSWNRGLGPFSKSELFIENDERYEIVELTEYYFRYKDLCK